MVARQPQGGTPPGVRALTWSLLVLSSLLTGACAPHPHREGAAHEHGVPPHPGRHLVEVKCSPCHSLRIIRESGGDSVAWEALTERMLYRNKARFVTGISDGDARTVIEYLAATQPPTMERVPIGALPTGRTPFQPPYRPGGAP